MEATTIRELYIKRVHEKELKITQKLNKAIKLQQEEARMRQEEARMRQEEARMRQEEARMRQEEAQKHREQLKIIVQSLYEQGNSVEKIAAIMSKSVESVQLIINNGELSDL
jgi:hypothetical protein